MFARMSRHHLTAPGIRRQRYRRSRGQNGTARYYPVSTRTQNSRLLIRGFGVRVPGGAPVLSWAFFRLEDRPVAVFGPGAREVLGTPLASFGLVRRGTTWDAATLISCSPVPPGRPPDTAEATYRQ